MISTVFFDVGGVILTNAWDHAERAAAAQTFHLDASVFEARHAPLAAPLELGVLGLDQYLDLAVFNQPRPFSRGQFVDFIHACSQPMLESLSVLEDLAQRGRVRLAVLNNEGRDLNQYRIAHFGLTRYFSVFCSSCYLGVRKPDAEIYARALAILQVNPCDCLFVDDREENLVAPRALGLDSLRFTSAAQLRQQLGARGLL